MIDFRKVKKNQNLINKIISNTKFIDDYCLNAKIYVYYNSIKCKPLCPVCQNPLKFRKLNPNKGFQKYCSHKCLNRAKKLKILDKKEFNKKLNHNNITNYIFSDIITKKKSKNGVIFKNLITGYSNRIDKNVIKYMKQYIEFETDNISELIYCFINDIKNKPICKNCNKNSCNYININSGYYEYCSNKCAASSRDKIGKTRKTWIKNYGVDNPMKSRKIVKKLSNTIKEKYNVEWYSKNNEYKEKIKETSLKKYGTEHPMKSNIVKENQKKIMLNKYNVNYNSQKNIYNYSEWIDDKKFIEVYNKLESVEDIAKYFNITSVPIQQRARKLNLLYKPNRQEVTIKKIGKTIESFGYNIEYNNRTIIKPLELDIIIRKNSNIVKFLEYNGIMFHSLGISSISKFNNYYKYKDNLSEFINKDRIKLDKCRKLGIELLILREDIYLNNPNIIDKWLNGELKYRVLGKPVIYRFKNVNKLETIQYRVCNNNYTNSHCRRPNKVLSSRVLREIEDSIENGYRIYFDWIDVEL